VTVEQRRSLVTAIPGPVSRELDARRAAAVSRGVGVTLPVYVAVAEALNELTPGVHEKRSALFNSGARAAPQRALPIGRGGSAAESARA